MSLSLLISSTSPRQRAAGSSYKAVFQTISLVCPNISIIVMATPEQLPEAVKILNDGTDSYLTYLILPDYYGLVQAVAFLPVLDDQRQL